MISIENLTDKVQIVSFFNKPILLDSIILAMVVFSTIVVLILLHHWGNYHPKKVVKLEQDEKVIEIFRKHWFVFFKDFMFFLPLATFFLILSCSDHSFGYNHYDNGYCDKQHHADVTGVEKSFQR